MDAPREQSNSNLQWLCLYLGIVAVTQAARLGFVTEASIVAGASLFLLSLATMKTISLGKIAAPTFCLLALLTYYGILSLATLSIEGIVNTVQIGIATLFFVLFYQMGRSGATNFKNIQLIAVTFALICTVWGREQAIVAHNTISGAATYLVLLSGIPWLLRSVRPIQSALAIFLLVSAVAALLGHRTGIVLGAVGFLTFLLLHFFPYRIVQVCTLGLVAFVLYVPIALFTSVGGFDLKYFDELLIEWTGRQAASGRQIIWPVIIEYVSEAPWLGLGPGTVFSDLYPLNLSASSYYMQTYMQAGLVGLALLVALLISLWFAVGRPRRKDPLSCYLPAVISIVIVHSATETFLMQANLVVGVIAWAALGLGFGAHDRFKSRVKDTVSPQIDGEIIEGTQFRRGAKSKRPLLLLNGD